MNGVTVTEFVPDIKGAGMAEAWFAARVTASRPYLLAHMDDGVIWGMRQDDGTLMLSGDVFPDKVAVSLRWTTLQQARLFGPGGELLIWRTPEGFAAREVSDAGVAPEAYVEDNYLLWRQGSLLRQANGFALLEEGRRGLLHAPPVIPKGSQRPKLQVRHYLDFDAQGQAYVCMSRLVALIP